MKQRGVSRRDFLRLSGITSAGLLLAACDSGSGGNQVRIMVDAWALAYAPFKEMADQYNQLHPETRIKIEPSPGGWMTKVVGQIRSKKLQWNAAGVMTTLNDLAAWVQLGMVQPVDALIANSKESAAGQYLSDMLAPVKADQSYEGKLYGIPFSVENITYQWNTDWFGKAGITQSPNTWQDLYDGCVEVKKYLASQGKKDVYAFGFDLGSLCRNLGTLIFGAADMPYTSEGLIAWDSPEMREALRFMRKMSRAGLTPPNGGEGVDIYDLWTRGRLAGLYSCSSRGVWAQKTLGFDKIVTSPVPTIDGKPHSGTTFWGNSLAILNTAPMPQQAMDYLLYAVGPQNAAWQQAIIKAGTSPAFASSYTQIIESDPEYANYRWMTHVRDSIAVSAPAPKNYFYPIENEAWNKHRAGYMKDNSTQTEDELIANVLKTIGEMRDQVLKSVGTVVP